MKRILPISARVLGNGLGLFFACGLWARVCAEVLPGWRTNLTETLKFAASSNRPVLLYFTADWCGPCRQMARTTFQDATVKTLLAEFITVALDFDVESTAAADRKVSAIPTFLILTLDGEEVTRTTGLLDPDRFQNFLNTALVASDLARDRQEEFRLLKADISSALVSRAPDGRKRAINRLLKLCGDKESARQNFARDQFKDLAAKTPSELIAGLEHERLAVRLFVAHALREQLGERFDFDPWAPSLERQAAVESLRKQWLP